MLPGYLNPHYRQHGKSLQPVSQQPIRKFSQIHRTLANPPLQFAVPGPSPHKSGNPADNPWSEPIGNRHGQFLP